MADWIKQGGAAFPIAHSTEPGAPVAEHGMTLRQYYAGQALAGLCANPGGPFQKNDMNGWGLTNCTETRVALACLDLADALLAEEGS
ncbi:hypothetical protein ASG43_03185 [Aureimonas sp. Leaf454]|uniref:hypothetical protein n=1 Tax=Aureimonas sp. Leaf454 TaxID=1736381 RepID=UPI0006FE016D|nr:hypothetical protein [Aureimonas sp. Leaf454]KQT54603.1 hypothetical protein ASG43_03185 [Aureimonas sp. Leaf454]